MEERPVTEPARRTEMFSDAVIAINITLIGLELKPPAATTGGVLIGLLHEWPVYVAYLTSFLSLAVAWVGHRAIFARVQRISGGLTWANIGVLLTIGLVPFPTRLVAESLGKHNSSDVSAALALYGVVGVLLASSYLILTSYLRGHPELAEESVDPGYFRRNQYRSLVGMVGWAAGGLLGYFTQPWIGLAIIASIPIFYGIASGGPTYESHPTRQPPPA